MTLNSVGCSEIADLPVIDFASLLCRDTRAETALFEACAGIGCFYLDLRHYDCELPGLLDDMYRLVEDVFDLPLEQKLRFDVDQLSELKICGYKPLGRNTGGMPGKRDGFETFMIPKNDLLLDRTAEYPQPHVVEARWKIIQGFARRMNHVNQVILATLSRSLGLSGENRLETLHRPDRPSPDMIRLLRYAPLEPGTPHTPHIPHTDTGSTTILFTRQEGLQISPPSSTPIPSPPTPSPSPPSPRSNGISSPILSPDQTELPNPSNSQATPRWQFVPPRDGHAIVNLGDGLALLTGQRLHSVLHRVAPIPATGLSRRTAFGYFLRAEDDVVLRPRLLPLDHADPTSHVQDTSHSLQVQNVDLQPQKPSHSRQSDSALSSIPQQNECNENGDYQTSREWLLSKFRALRHSTFEDKDAWMVNGGQAEPRHVG